MKRGLGDVIKDATKAVGIKPCEGCQKRAEALNRLSRRGILKSGALALFGLKNSTLMWLWEQAGATVPVSVDLALGLVRQLNTIQAVLKGFAGAYGTQHILLTDPVHGIVSFVPRLNTDTFPGDWIYEWLSRVDFSSNNVLPGWVLDFVLMNDGYRLILNGPQDVLITDETGVIYRAPITQNAPKAVQLTNAKSYPNGVPHNLYEPGQSLRQRLLDFFTPKVVHAAPTGCDSISHCLATWGSCCACATNCCGPVQCLQNPPVGYYNCFAAIGCSNPPFLQYGYCPKTNPFCYACSACTEKYWGIACMCSCAPCSPQC